MSELASLFLNTVPEWPGRGSPRLPVASTSAKAWVMSDCIDLKRFFNRLIEALNRGQQTIIVRVGLFSFSNRDLLGSFEVGRRLPL